MNSERSPESRTTGKSLSTPELAAKERLFRRYFETRSQEIRDSIRADIINPPK